MTPRSFFAAPILLLSACYSGTPDLCPKHCWGFTQAVDNEGGYFPSGGIHEGECYSEAFQEVRFTPALPTPAEFDGKVCLDTQSEHESVKTVIEAIRYGPSCYNALDQADVDVYNDLILDQVHGGGIAIELRLACRAFLGAQGCDVTSDPDGKHELAWDLCDYYVMDPAEAAMSDTSGCNGWVPPSKVIGAYSTESSCDFHPDLATTGADTGLVCDDEGVDVTGADSTGADSTGADSTGSSMLGDPFGDVQALVSCTPALACQIDPELLTNVTDNFQTFYDEEVWLEMVTISGVGNGAQITGVDSGEEAEALLDAFGIQDEDVITHVNSIELDQEEDVLEVLYEIPGATSWSVTVRRWNGTSWSTLNYSISLAS